MLPLAQIQKKNRFLKKLAMACPTPKTPYTPR